MIFIKEHWFGLLMSIFVVFFVIVFSLVLASPRVDNQNRGFITCTQAMSINLMECKNAKTCMVKEVVKNTFCDIKIVKNGFKMWIKGEQKTPWSNYLFTPELEEQNLPIDEEIEEQIDEQTK